MSKLTRVAVFFASLLAPAGAFAHEMYVLPSAMYDAGMLADSPNPFAAYVGNEYQFYIWAFVALVVVSTIFAATIFRWFERASMPFFHTMKRFAHPILRAGTGACLLYFGANGALFGPEVRLFELFGGNADAVEAILLVCGGAILAGFMVRYIAIVLIALWLYTAASIGLHILNYADFLGAFIALLILGAGSYSIDHLTGMFSAIRHKMARFTPLAFPIVRVLFGFGIMFAAIFAKYMHSQLALDVVDMYHLTDYLRFDPLFVVLGALIIEFLAGAMLMLGIAVRWTSAFLIFWLTLSQIYFREPLWYHLILFTIGFAIIAHGYDRYSLEGRVMKRKGSEPML